VKLVEEIIEGIKRLKEDRNNFIERYEDLKKDLGGLPNEISALKTKLNDNEANVRNLTYFTTNLDSNIKSLSPAFESNKALVNKLQQATSSLLYEYKGLKSKTERDISLLDNKIMMMEARMNMVATEDVRPLLSDLTRSISEIKDLMKVRVKGLEHEVQTISNRLENYELQFKLSDTMNTLSRLGPDPLKIKNSLEVLRILIERMRHVGLWNEDRQALTVNFLEELINSWTNYGYEKIAELYRAEAERLRKKTIEEMSAKLI
jgi:chromosome segregation ATPase